MRPFEWGLDWMSRPTDTRASTPEERVERWVADVMSDTGAFFDAPPTSDYQFDRPRHRAHGEKRARCDFRARSSRRTRKTTRFMRDGFRRGTAAAQHRAGRPSCVLPQWNSDPEGHIGLSRLLARCGVSALRMSLPYHDDAHAGRTDSRRLHRQLEHRAHDSGVPPGGARREARHRLAGAPGIRAHRHPRHEPRFLPGDADHRTRAAHPRAGPEPRIALVCRCRVAGACRRSTCAKGSTAISSCSGSRACGGPISPFSYLERVGMRRRSWSTHDTT